MVVLLIDAHPEKPPRDPETGAVGRWHPNLAVCGRKSRAPLVGALNNDGRVRRGQRSDISACGDSEPQAILEPRFNSWNLGPHPNGRPRTITLDFAIVRGLRTVVRVIDAKPPGEASEIRGLG